MFEYAKRFKEQVYADGKAEGLAEGEIRGIQMTNQAWIEWFDRKAAAEAAGEPFDEPSPAERHANGDKVNGSV